MAFEAHNDVPIEKLVPDLIQHALNGRAFYLKFTCSSCGERLMIEEVNTVYYEGVCDKCKSVTDLTVQGAGYALAIPSTPAGKENVQNLVAQSLSREGVIRHNSGYAHLPDLTKRCPECAMRN